LPKIKTLPKFCHWISNHGKTRATNPELSRLKKQRLRYDEVPMLGSNTPFFTAAGVTLFRSFSLSVSASLAVLALLGCKQARVVPEAVALNAPTVVSKTPRQPKAHIEVQKGDFSSQGTRIYFQNTRSSQNLGQVLLLPGAGESFVLYDNLIQELAARGLNVWTLDLPGLGASRFSNQPRQTGKSDGYLDHVPSLDVHVSAVNDFLNTFPREENSEPFSVIATSTSAGLALELALKLPLKIHKIVLVSPLFELRKKSINSANHYAFLSAQVLLGKGLLPVNFDDLSSEAWNRENSPLTRDRASGEWVQDQLHGNEKLISQGGTQAFAKALIDASYRIESEANKLRMPTLILGRKKPDTSFELSLTKEICERIPLCTRIVFDNSGEKVLFEKEEVRAQVKDHILRFLNVRTVTSESLALERKKSL
jgi:alpha-beta hydrolase superfamily lysophospholipase